MKYFYRFLSFFPYIVLVAVFVIASLLFIGLKNTLLVSAGTIGVVVVCFFVVVIGNYFGAKADKLEEEGKKK